MNDSCFCQESGRRNLSGVFPVLVFLFLLNAAFVSPSIANKEKCLRYDPEVVTLTGTLKEEIHPGPPNYHDIENGDKPIAVWFLFLFEPVCVFEKIVHEDYTLDGEENVRKIQLDIEDLGMYRQKRFLLNKKTAVTGTLYHAIWGHHFTPVLISVGTSGNMQPGK